MDDREVFKRMRRNNDVRDSFGGRRKRGEKRERKMAHSLSKLWTMGPVPGIDGVEGFQLRDASPFHHSHQIQTRIGDSPGTVGEADQRKHGARRPNFGVSRASGLERGERKDNVADRTGPNQKSSTGDKIACPTAING